MAAPGAKPASGAVRLDALDGPRYLASAHVVGFHYYWNLTRYFDLGGMWTQFFFIMGGFLLSYAEMSKPAAKRPKLKSAEYLKKRLTAIYPLYIFALVMMMMVMQPQNLMSWCSLPLHLVLLQAVLPICAQYGSDFTCTSYTFNSVSWFLSCLVVYWLMLRPLARRIERLSLGTCFIWLLCLWAWSVVPVLAWSLLGKLTHEEGYAYAMYGNALQSGPLGYLHVFLAGIFTARIFVLTSMRDASTGEAPVGTEFSRLVLSSESAPWLLRNGTLFGYALWVAFAAAWMLIMPGGPREGYVKYTFYFFHNGGLLPVLVLVFLGSAIGADILSTYVFRLELFKFLGKVSYAQYLLQEPVGHFLGHYVAPGQENPSTLAFRLGFPPLLILSAYLSQRFIERPYSEWQRTRQQAGIIGIDEAALAAVDRQLKKSGALLADFRTRFRPRRHGVDYSDDGDTDGWRSQSDSGSESSGNESSAPE